MSSTRKFRQHKFQPGARSIIQMGEELIGHPSTAINELVKNGYDADATSCKVYFHYAKHLEKSFAVIFDNGSGMNEDILFGDWLQPSKSEKRNSDSKSEKYKRHFLGSKGIGRLAAMAVGRYVTVVTKKSNETEYNWLTVDRQLFKRDTLLNTVHFPGDKTPAIKDLFLEPSYLKERKVFENKVLTIILSNNNLLKFSSGTLIIIEQFDPAVKKILEDDFLGTTELFDKSLRDTEFYKSLATLITPLKLSSDIQKELLKKGVIKKAKTIASEGSNFTLDFSCNLLPDSDKKGIEWLPVNPIPIHKAFDYRVFGKVTSDGKVEGYFVYNRLKNDVHEETFQIGPEEIENSLLESDVLDQLIEDKKANPAGEYYFDIRVYDIGEKDNLQKLAESSGFESSIKFRNSFKTFQGLRVSKNGFGVKPYGEEVEDWIGLSKARVQDPGHNVNTNQILGYVFFFSPENDILEEKTNREGFLENAAFFEVRNTLLTIFKSLGKLRYNYRALHNLGRIPTSKHTRPDFETFLSTINTNNNLKQIREYSEKFMKEVTTSMDNLEESLTFSERLASLGSGIELVYHEMAQPISRLRTANSSLSLKKHTFDKKNLDKFLYDLTSLEEATDVLVELRKSLQPAIGKSRKKLFKPYNTFLKVCSLFKTDINENEIKIISDPSLGDFELNDLEYAFWIAFLNIVNNAVYWIKKSERKGEIRFNIENEKIIISNSGPLIVKELIEHIFTYGVTTKKEKNATGLGLAYTQRTLTSIGWDITAENRKNGPAFIIQNNGNAQ